MSAECMEFQTDTFSLAKTLDSGQNIRSTLQADGFYRLISCRQICCVRQSVDFGHVELIAPSKDSMLYWVYVLGLSEPETSMVDLVEDNQFLQSAVACGRGIRIMHQDPWEALITFIISQRNNIPRILATVEKLCSTAGAPAGYGLYYFPSPQELLAVNLSNVGLGYRLPYILSAARMVEDGEINLESLQAGLCNSETALQMLLTIPGVGIKVAGCTAVFGLGHRDVFPVDIWIERAMAEAKIDAEDIRRYGNRASLLQQYIYYYMLHRK